MMNPKIRELADQCYHRYSEYHIDLERFAHLIILECCEQVKNLRVNDYGISGDQIIRQHFGADQ